MATNMVIPLKRCWNDDMAGSQLWLTEKGAGRAADEHALNGPVEIETDGKSYHQRPIDRRN
jgi:hypothetical protein